MKLQEQLENLYKHNGECISSLKCSECIIQYFCDGDCTSNIKSKFKFAGFMLNKLNEEE